MEPLEPWVGYAKMTPEQRKETLDKKISNAKGMGDQPYALALTAAVVNYELLLKHSHGDADHDEPTKDHAEQHYHGASSWIGT